MSAPMNRRDALRLGAAGALAPIAPLATASRAAEDYKLGPDSQPQEGVPQGDVRAFQLAGSRVFPGARRDCWVYVPKQYDGSRPACVMVFQDGGWFQDRGGGWRVPVVFDNLIHRKEMPVSVGVFVNPGVVPAADEKAALPRYNRSFEYDGMGDRYARFLLEELLPEVQKRFGLKITDDPAGRALCGASSGGSCSFTAAWERPDAFGKVVSFIGSFTDLHGAHNYATMVRKREPKPIRVFLQDGSDDQDIYAGSWFQANNDLAAALRFAGYDARYVVGDGGHDGRHGGAILPDALRWLWRDFPGVVSKVAAESPPPSRQPIQGILVAGQGWEEVPNLTGRPWQSIVAGAGGGYTGTAGGADGAAVAMGPRETVYSYEPRRKRITTAPSPTPGTAGKSMPRREAVRGVATAPASLVVNHVGVLFWADGSDGRLWTASGDGKGKARPLPGVPADAPRFGAVALTPDQTLLVAAPRPDSPARWAWSGRLTPDGSADWQPYFDLFAPHGAETAGVRGLCCDEKGWLYAATPAGIQVLDQAGRVNGILAPPPAAAPPISLAFAGPDRAFLYCVAGGRLWRRRLNARGAHPADAPLRPPPPRL